jgi:3-hydroxyisobutyrate dehydrogenase-like beta-hydroxyacid dehydrogenase
MSGAARDRTIGFVGLGAMGGPMARNLLKAGRPLVVYDIDRRKTELFATLGAEVALSPADVAARATICISMVDTTAQSEEVITGPNGFIASAKRGDVVVSMSTIDPFAVEDMMKRLSEKGIEIIDAPVSGMIHGAEAGTLKAYVGGEASALEKCRGALEAMNAEVHHIGSIGQGIMMKLVNNMLAQAGRVLVVEAMVMGAKAGLDPRKMVDLVGNATGNSVVFQHAAPRLLSRDFTGIRMDITIKDLELETQVAKRLNAPMFMANVAQQVYMMAKAAGHGDEDPAAVVKVYEQLTGVSLAEPGAESQGRQKGGIHGN